MKKIFTILFFAILGLNNINGATFSSVASGTWSTPATWTITSGTDSDGIPDADDDVTISTAHTVTLTATSVFKTLLIQSGGLLNANSQKVAAKGDITILGSVTGTLILYIQGVCLFTSTPVYTRPGDWYIQSGSLTIAAGTTINKNNFVIVSSGVSVFNNGTFTGSLQLNGSGKWINNAGSNLNAVRNIAGPGVLTATAVPNTVTYINSLVTQIKPTTYYNLVLNAGSTKSLTANTAVLNDFTMGAGTLNIFNLNNFNLSIGGNWNNNAGNTLLNQGIITFNGSGTQIISRSSSNEVFNNMVVDGTGTVLLNRNLNITQDLTINSGTFDVSASNFTVDIKGDLTNNGAINARQGLFTFTGTSAQTISGTQGTSFNDLTTANAAGVSVLSNVAVFYMLTVNSGSFGTSGSGIITIPASGPTTYARIGTISGSLFGTGWVLESYVNGPAQAGWQWLSSPTSNSTLADWDNDPRFYMSGVGGNDGTAAGFRSVRTYNETTGLYTNITTTNTPLTPGKGFNIWMSDNMTSLTTPLVYNSIGTPNFGTINFPVTAGGAGSGYNLVGNPYACPINYNTVVAASGNLFSSFVILLEDNTYATDPNSGIISPNQGFMCVASTGGNIVFTEACKEINGNPNLLKTANQENSITFSVYNNINGIGGRTNINFTKNGTDNFENGADLSFLTSPSEDADNIYTKSMDHYPLLRNILQNDGNEKHIPLTVKSGVFGSHFISAKGLSNLNLYNSVWLEDLATGKKVDLLKNQEYEFNADEIGKDYEFIIHFSNSKKSTENTGITNTNLLNENTSVYNTPSNVVVKFNMNESTFVSISVYNLAGQKVMETINANVTDDRIALPIQKENGLYLLLIQSGDEQITRKIIY